MDQVTPAYHTMARLITGLPKWTPLKHLMREASLPPRNLYLHLLSQRYGACVLRQPDGHPCKELLLCALWHQGPHPRNGIGLDRIATLLLRIIGNPDALQCAGTPTQQYLPDPEIAKDSKYEVSKAQMEWIPQLPPQPILLYTDGSKDEQGRTASGWACLKGGSRGWRV